MTRSCQSSVNRRSLMRFSAITGAVGALVAAAGARTARAQAVSSAGKLSSIISRGHLVVGTGSDIPPFYFKDEKGELAGFEPDLARMMAKSLFNDAGKVEFIVQGSDARIPNILSDRVDVTLQNLTVTPARALQVEFSIPYYRAGAGFVLLANGPYKSYEDLKTAGSKITVSALQNVFIADWVRDALPEARTDQYPSPDAAMQALDGGRADAHLIDYAKVQYLVKRFPDRYRDSAFTFKANSIAAAVKPGEQAWLNWINSFLREAMAGVNFDDTTKIYEHWLEVELPQPRLGYPRELLAS